MPYRIHHRTVYRYEQHVSYSHHLARLTPLDAIGQHQASSRLVVDPVPDVLAAHRDYFGNTTTYFSITSPHRTLTIENHAEVQLDRRPEPALDLSPPWESVRDRMRSSLQAADLAAGEFVFPSALAPTHPTLADYARKSFRPGRPVLEAAADLNSRLNRDFSFDPTATTVSTPVMEVFEKRAGVCQDFAHLQISCLRSIGLPARYASGYLRTDPPPGKPRLIGADASHAWTALYLPDLGWTEFDATNDVLPASNHIRVANGRDYHDICPIRGTVYGGGAQSLEIGVTVIEEE